MSLSEKLSKKSQELEKAEAVEAEKKLAEELAPVRARIAEIEGQKRKLELIKGSLELKSDKNVGKGMKEYEVEVKKTKKEKATKIDILVEKNKKVLEAMNIKDRDDLMKNEEFKDEEEIAEYKSAEEQGHELEKADKALIQKLEKLGVSISPDEFSYESAEQAVSEKLKEVEDELLQQKLKTPEGRGEVIETLAKNLEKSIPKTELTFNKETGQHKLSFEKFNRRDTGIFISNEGARFGEWYDVDLIPEDIKKIEATYGADVANEALQKAYQSKVHEAVVSFDVNGENVLAVKKHIESIHPQEADNAEDLLRKFEKEQEKFRLAMQEKSKELEKVGIEFDTEYAPGWGGWGKYEDFIALGESGFNEKVKNALKNKYTFPPQFDFIKLQSYITERIDSVKEFTSAIKNLKTQDDINKFSGSNEKRTAILKAHADLRELKEKIRVGFYFQKTSHDSSANKLVDEITSKIKTYSDAEEYLNKKIQKLSDIEDKALEKIKTGILMEKNTGAFRDVLQKENFNGGRIDYIENEFRKVEDDKKEALSALQELILLESELPKDEEVVLGRGSIYIPSVTEKIKKLEGDRKNIEESIQSARENMRVHGMNKPKLFGKDSWEEKMINMETEKNAMEKDMKKMDDELNELKKKQFFYIKTRRYSKTEDIIDKQNARGTTKEVLDVIRAELNKVVERRVPESVMGLYRQRKELEEKLKR